MFHEDKSVIDIVFILQSSLTSSPIWLFWLEELMAG